MKVSRLVGKPINVGTLDSVALYCNMFYLKLSVDVLESIIQKIIEKDSPVRTSGGTYIGAAGAFHRGQGLQKESDHDHFQCL